MLVGMSRAERPFVANSWLRSYEHEGMGEFSRANYWRIYSAIVDGYLDREPTMVLLNPEDKTQILAFANYSKGGILNYLYVKSLFRDYRKQSDQPRLAFKVLAGLGLAQSEFVHTFTTPAWRKWSEKHGLRCRYIPHSVPRLKLTHRVEPCTHEALRFNSAGEPGDVTCGDCGAVGHAVAKRPLQREK